MNLTWSGKFIKYLLFAFNLIFVITGIIILGVGVSVKAYYYKYDTFLDDKFFSLPNLLIATGVIIFFISFFGCCGAIKENHLMILIFSGLLILIFIFEFSAGIAGYVLRDKTASYLEEKLTESQQKYNGNDEFTAMWDTIQKQFECCGVNNYTDWGSVYPNGSLPVSCCPPKNGISGAFYCLNNETDSKPTNNKLTTPPPSTSAPYNIGCEEAFGNFLKDHAVDIGAVGITLAILQLIGILFACYLARQLKNCYHST